MEEMQTLKKLIIQESRRKLEENDVTDMADLFYDLGFDSITSMSLVVRLEMAFGIVIDDDDMSLDFMKTVDSLYRYVLTKLGKERGKINGVEQ